MKSIILSTYLLLLTSNVFAQVIHVSSLENKLYRLDIENCSYEEIVTVNAQLFDISFHPNGDIYGISGDGTFFKIDTLTGQTEFVYQFDGGFNSLTTSADGMIYATGWSGNLWSYDLNASDATYLGNMGYAATGDLTFINGELYVAASGNQIVRVDITNPSNSQVVITQNVNGSIFGIVSFAEDCSDIDTYVLTGYNADIYKVDLATNSLTFVCDLDIDVSGGASTFEFFGSAPITIESSHYENPNCGVNDGSISVVATGGGGPLNYSIDGTNFQEHGIFENLETGNYTVHIKASEQCKTTLDFYLAPPNAPEVTHVAIQNTTCLNAYGSFSITATGASLPLQYSIDGTTFQLDNSFNDLPEGNYTIYVKDANNCTRSQSVAIGRDELPQILQIDVDKATCGIEDGSIAIQASGGKGLLSYALNGGSFQQVGLFENLAIGDYEVTVIDENQCETKQTVTVTNENLILSLVAANPITCEAANGVIEVSGDLGTVPYRYSLNNLDFQNSGTFPNLNAGVYTVYMIDSVGCRTQLNVELESITPAKIDGVSIKNATCNDANGRIAVASTGGNTVYYSLDGVNFQTSNQFNDLGAAVYQVTIKDENECTDSREVALTSSAPPLIQHIQVEQATCEQANGQVTIEASGGEGELSYSLDGITYQESSIFNGLNAGTYLIYVQDVDHCVTEGSIFIAGSPQVHIQELFITPAVCGAANAQLDIRTQGGTGLLSYKLNDLEQTDSIFLQLLSGNYILSVTDEKNCQASRLVSIEEGNCSIYIPNAFSPNGDGINDEFRIKIPDDFNGQINYITIYNRWGQAIYGLTNASAFDALWDGNSHKGEKLSPGVYTYIFEIELRNGDKEVYRGAIVVLR
ncbi:MAG: gliding motility-associated C-terminal domain-containing protein [Flammeovirgaceae bacterium]